MHFGTPAPDPGKPPIPACNGLGLLIPQKVPIDPPTVRRIWGFGSTFDERLRFRESSDIDLAVEGGSLAAWRISQRSPWKVDWVELDDQDESMVRSIATRGVVLYER